MLLLPTIILLLLFCNDLFLIFCLFNLILFINGILNLPFQDFQLKEQCRNCTFLNGQFSDECEMCGEPISGGRLKPPGRSAIRY